MQITSEDLEDSVTRIIMCETHNKRCQLIPRINKCPCCKKRLCLCNYIL